MNLTPKEVKFLTILNETRLSNGKLLKCYSERLRKEFSFKDKELREAIKKLSRNGLLTEMDLGGNDIMYFFTEKVSKDMLDKKLEEITCQF